MSKPIAYSCGFCGAPCDERGKQIYPVPDGYDPDSYKHDVCNPCRAEQSQINARDIITHEMAMDAQDLSLEGQEW